MGWQVTYKVYMENPYLKEIDAKITEKRYRNNKYYLKLNRTIFYPHLAGGQPGDIGTINGIDVLETLEDGDDIIYIIDKNINSANVKVVIDWENRIDLMQQHTGQHLLSSCFYRLFNFETVGFYIGKEYVYIDVTTPDLREEEAEQAEILANRIIQSNFQIRSYFITNQELSKIPLRKSPIVSNDIRIVEIDSIDYSPCCGTHLNNTGEIGLIKIRKWEKYKGNTRIEFVCGNRAIKDYMWKSKFIRDIAFLLSSKDKDVYDKVNKLYNDREVLEKENRNLREALNKYKAESLLKEAQSKEDIRLIYKELTDTDFKEINYISSCLNNESKLVQIYVLKNNNRGQFFISRTKDLQVNLQSILKTISENYQIKGGGSPHTIQGGTSADDLYKIANEFKENILKHEKG